MAKWITISLFALLTLLKPVSQFAWQLWYEVNQDFVARTLCENKAKPALECNGKCYLTKQLKKAEVSPSSDTEQKKENRINPFILKVDLLRSTQFDWSFSSECSHGITTYNGRYSAGMTEGSPSTIFHPPIA